MRCECQKAGTVYSGVKGILAGPPDKMSRRYIERCDTCVRISQLAIFSLALVLAVGAWSCSTEPPMHGAVGTPYGGVIVRGPIPASPTATPTPSQ